MKQLSNHMLRLGLLSLLALICAPSHAQNITLSGPAGSGQFGKTVTVLTNGNYVVCDPYWDNGATADVGAVYLYNGNTHNLISTLTGSTASDLVGNNGVTALTSGNFVVISTGWDNGATTDAGAVTWVNGATGLTGTVTSSNSLVGGTASDQAGSGGITALSNGNYVVRSPVFDNGAAVSAGAVTWGSGTAGVTGVISSSNSLVGSTTSDGVGSVTALNNGNYVVVSSNWDNGATTNVGAVTWASGTNGVSGVISSSNSLVGTIANSSVGSGGITQLSNGNFVVRSTGWDNGATLNVGAVTWASGTSGISGAVSSSNSLIGTTASDAVGTVIALTNGNYVVLSAAWNNGAVTDAGAVTWGSGTSGVSGTISSGNSLVGSTASDMSSAAVTALPNGNYVVSTPNWDNGAFSNAGASTWANGTTGITGTISSSTSLVGTKSNDRVANGGTTALSNGNYVVRSYFWSDGVATSVGAVTWGSGTAGVSGTVSSSNSQVGSTASDFVGGGGTYALTNGNYVTRSSDWDNGAVTNVGAIMWGNGTTGSTGIVSSSNALVGSTAGDYLGNDGITLLSNGNYVVSSTAWDNGAAVDAGAATWCNGTTGTSGQVSSANSLVGSSTVDNVGYATPLTNGNYMVSSYTWDNGAMVDAGAVTWGSGTAGVAGAISSSNSLVGSTSYDQIGITGIVTLANGNCVVSTTPWDNGAAADAGAVTWVNGSTGITGTINSANSVIGSSTSDLVGLNVYSLANGNYVMGAPYWNNASVDNAGATTWGNGTSGSNGVITSSNSMVGSTMNDEVGDIIYRQSNGAFFAMASDWDGVAGNSGAYIFSTGTSAITGTPAICNSVLGGVASSLSSSSQAYSSTNEYLLVGLWGENKVVIFTPATQTLAIASTSSTQSIAGTGKTPFVDNTCQLINSLQQAGSSPVNGAVANGVYVETSAISYAGKTFVRRHYEITPAINPASSTARLTLYFTQGDFDHYNINNGADADLPSGPSDAAGIAQLRISHQHGTSVTGDPGSYSGSTNIIDPSDADVVWNNTLSRWEVTFDITGFSGFFAFGDNTALPLNLLSFNARLLSNSDVELRWNVANQSGNETYTVERSIDGSNFRSVGSIGANTSSEYTLHDYQPWSGKSYYRLKITPADGGTTYSEVRSIFIGGKGDPYVNVYPSPAKNYFIIESSAPGVTGTLTDMQGRILMNIKSNRGDRIDVSALAQGVYVLKLENGYSCRIVKD